MLQIDSLISVKAQPVTQKTSTQTPEADDEAAAFAQIWSDQVDDDCAQDAILSGADDLTDDDVNFDIEIAESETLARPDMMHIVETEVEKSAPVTASPTTTKLMKNNVKTNPDSFQSQLGLISPQFQSIGAGPTEINTIQPLEPTMTGREPAPFMSRAALVSDRLKMVRTTDGPERESPHKTARAKQYILPSPDLLGRTNPAPQLNRQLTPDILSSPEMVVSKPVLAKVVPLPFAGDDPVEPEGILSPVSHGAHALASAANPIVHRASGPQVATQIAAAIIHSSGATTEIALNPEELGRVRIALTHNDAGVTVSILSERPETADLMRRNIAQLARELSGLGYDNPTFTFDGHSDHSDQGRQDGSAQAPPDLPHIITEQSPPGLHVVLSGGLDLKL